MDFQAASLFDALAGADQQTLDGVDFGVVEMTRDGTVVRYNSTEAKIAGVSPERVIGKHFFTEVAPCTNNFLVSQRFMDEASLDAVVPYVFTLRMKPRKVHLRLLRKPDGHTMYLCVQTLQ